MLGINNIVVNGSAPDLRGSPSRPERKTSTTRRLNFSSTERTRECYAKNLGFYAS